MNYNVDHQIFSEELKLEYAVIRTLTIYFAERRNCVKGKNVPSDKRRRYERSPGNSERTEFTAPQCKNGKYVTIPLRSDLELDTRNYPKERSEMNFFSSCLHIHNFGQFF